MVDLAQVSYGLDRLSCGFVSQNEIDPPVDLGFVGRVSRGQDGAYLEDLRSQNFKIENQNPQTQKHKHKPSNRSTKPNPATTNQEHSHPHLKAKHKLKVLKHFYQDFHTTCIIAKLKLPTNARIPRGRRPRNNSQATGIPIHTEKFTQQSIKEKKKGEPVRPRESLESRETPEDAKLTTSSRSLYLAA